MSSNLRRPNLEFLRPSVVQIATVLHRSKHADCGLPADHIDFELAVAIVADREGWSARARPVRINSREEIPSVEEMNDMRDNRPDEFAELLSDATDKYFEMRILSATGERLSRR